MSHKNASGHLPHPLSIKPYNEVVLAGKPGVQRERILDVLRLGSMNRRMIAAATRLPVSSVCWRVKGMLKSGILEVVSTAEDPATGQETEFLAAVVPALAQRTFSDWLWEHASND